VRGGLPLNDAVFLQLPERGFTGTADRELFGVRLTNGGLRPSDRQLRSYGWLAADLSPDHSAEIVAAHSNLSSQAPDDQESTTALAIGIVNNQRLPRPSPISD